MLHNVSERNGGWMILAVFMACPASSQLQTILLEPKQELHKKRQQLRVFKWTWKSIHSQLERSKRSQHFWMNVILRWLPSVRIYAEWLCCYILPQLSNFFWQKNDEKRKKILLFRLNQTKRFNKNLAKLCSRLTRVKVNRSFFLELAADKNCWQTKFSTSNLKRLSQKCFWHLSPEWCPRLAKIISCSS